jgi:hypothetical protein
VRSKLRIAELAPIAAPVVPESGRSIEELVYLMTEELVRRGHDVTAEAFSLAREFDVIHSHNYEFSLPFSRLVVIPAVHTYHVMADADIAQACARVPNVHLVAISEYQASCTPPCQACSGHSPRRRHR